jgi:hypothetical protein
MNRVKFFLMAVTAILFLSGIANAEIVTFKFTGTVTYGGTLVAEGTRITGIFSYDTDAEPAYALPGQVDYAIPAPFVISGSVGDHIIIAYNLRVFILNDYHGNVEDMIEVAGGPVLVDNNLYTNGNFGFRLASKPGNIRALKGTKLPACLNLHAFDAGNELTYGWLQSDGGAGGQIIQFTIDSIVGPGICRFIK